MFKIVGKYWNADFDIISDGKDFYVLNENEWNDEKWFDCWKVLDKKGLKKSDDKSSYTIKPIYKEIDTDDFEIIDYEVSEDV